MFSAWPCCGTDNGYMPCIRAPSQYSGSRGPGTFEMIRLTEVGARSATPGTWVANSGPVAIRPVSSWVCSVLWVASCALALFIEAMISVNRRCGSASWVAKLQGTIPTALPLSPKAPSERSDTGTPAVSALLGSASCSIR